MREALPALREALPGVRLGAGRDGPEDVRLRRRRVGRRLLQLDDARVRRQTRERVEEGAREAGREPPPDLRLRPTAVGANAEERLAKDESFYRDMHQGYRGHFDRQGAPEGTVGVAAENAGVVQEELSRYRALDTVVVRALASATLEDMSALAEAAAPGVEGPGRLQAPAEEPVLALRLLLVPTASGTISEAQVAQRTRSLGGPSVSAVCFSASVSGAPQFWQRSGNCSMVRSSSSMA